MTSSSPLLQELDRCVACGRCRAVCPTFIAEGEEIAVARGKLKLLQGAENGVLAYDSALSRLIDNCLGCRLCVESCPQNVRTDELIYAARQKLRETLGRKPLELFLLRYLLPRRGLLMSAARFIGKLQRLGGWFFGFSDKRSRKLTSSQQTQRALRGIYRLVLPLAGLSPRLIPPTLATKPFSLGRGELLHNAGVEAPRYALFLGCAIDLAYPETAEAMVSLAKTVGVSLISPQKQVCCGLPAYSNGDRRTAHQLAAANQAAFSAENYDGIITACASCASFLREQYPQFAGADSPLAHTLTLQEFLTERLDKLPLKRDPNLTITWHQPCHLSRHLSVELAEPLLRRVGNYIEMEEKAVCCGGAGSYFAKFPETSAAIGERKARNIIATGADVVATACPACAMQLSASLASQSANVRVVLLGELLVGEPLVD